MGFCHIYVYVVRLKESVHGFYVITDSDLDVVLVVVLFGFQSLSRVLRHAVGYCRHIFSFGNIVRVAFLEEVGQRIQDLYSVCL